jgi:hypothetical protein
MKNRYLVDKNVAKTCTSALCNVGDIWNFVKKICYVQKYQFELGMSVLYKMGWCTITH